MPRYYGMEDRVAMSNENIKRYTMAEIRKMIAAGQYYPTPDDAPLFPADDNSWETDELAVATDRTVVELDLPSSTVEQFKKSGPDYLKRMADVLENQAKKAS